MAAMKRLLVIALAACASHSAAPPQPPAQPADSHEQHADAHAEHADAHAHHGDGTEAHRFQNAEHWATVFDDPARDAWQRPDEVVAALALAPGMTVADIGAGTGYFEKRLSTAVGGHGAVIAVDAEPDMVRYLGERAQREGTANVEARLGTADDPKLAPGSVDRILIVDTWHHIANRVAYGKKLAAALKPGGAVFVVDFTLESKKPPPKHIRLAPTKVVEEFTQAGLKAIVLDVKLPDQYIVKASR
jgi:cyclopropane fatty-acyl-phospholipid synthase-like methyltransferase